MGGTVRRYSMATMCFQMVYLPFEIIISFEMPHMKINIEL